MELTFKDKNILVTGGTGFVGSHLVEKLLLEKANVVTTFLSTHPSSYFIQKKLSNKVSMAHMDICDYEKVFDLITKFHIDYIFHLAAQPIVDVAYANPKKTLYTNIIGTINILESARLNQYIKGVIVASSDKAYGPLSRGREYIESYPLQGSHPYEVSKSSADLISSSYFKTYKTPVVITRFGNIYGEGDLNFSRIIPGIMKSIITKSEFEMRSDGTYIRDYLHVKDVVNGYILLGKNIDSAKGEAYNFGSEETLSVIEMIQRIEKTLNKKISYKKVDSAKNEIPYQSLDYSKINQAVGWITKNKLTDSLPEIYSYYQSIL
jgi:CDP-glucose 4,6-dehydratase